MTYQEQLNDYRWTNKSNEIRERDDHTCILCGSERKLNVHHVKYIKGRMAWEYENFYLMTVCNTWKSKTGCDGDNRCLWRDDECLEF